MKKSNSILYKGVLWQVYNYALIPSVSADYELDINNEEAKQLLKKTKAWLVRWTTEFDSDRGEFWYIIKDKFNDFDEFSSNIRNQIRRGLKNYYTKIIDKNYLINYGYEVYLKSFERYSNAKPYRKEIYIKDLLSKDNNWEFWGLFERNSNLLEGYSANYIISNSVELKTIKVKPLALKGYASYVLIYEMCKYYLKDKNYKYINDGCRSILHETEFQEFLNKKFNFRKAYCKMNIVYNPFLYLIIKIFYPFRRILKLFKRNILISRLNALLLQEEIRLFQKKYFN